MKLRTSQINGCAYCLDMHSKDALAAGETPQRLVALAAWQETPFFTDRERAALAWLFSTHMLVLMPGSGTKNEPQMNADRRRFSSGLRSQYWAMITNLVVTVPLAPWFLIELKKQSCNLRIIRICVNLRSSAAKSFCPRQFVSIRGFFCAFLRLFAAILILS